MSEDERREGIAYMASMIASGMCADPQTSISYTHSAGREEIAENAVALARRIMARVVAGET